MIAAALVVLAAGAGLFWLLSRDEPTAPQAVAQPQVEPEPIAETVVADEKSASLVDPAEEAPAIPEIKVEGPTVVEERVMQLDQSDEELREPLSNLAPQPELAQWLMMRDLVRSFVVAVDNIAEGRTPRPHLVEVEPAGSFRVREEGGRVFVDPASYARYDTISEVFVALDVEAAVELYIEIYPLMQQAYEELGYPDQSFDDTLERAISELLAVPKLVGPVELELLIVSYAFADFELEGLTAAQKQLLRMGPENVTRIQQKLRDLAVALAMNTDDFPAPSQHTPRSFDDSNPEPQPAE